MAPNASRKHRLPGEDMIQNAPTLHNATPKPLDIFIKDAVSDALNGQNQREKQDSAILHSRIQANKNFIKRVSDACQMSSLIKNTGTRDKEIEALSADIQKSEEKLDELEMLFPDFAEVTRLHDAVTELDRKLERIIDFIVSE